MSGNLRPVLAAEDEESDAMILRLAFQKLRSLHPLILVRDGQEAVDYLSGKGDLSDRSVYPLPALIVVDLKMPRMNGTDVLGWLAMRPEFKDIPAVVLSSSGDESDIRKARQLGARGYFVKPHAFDDLKNILRQIEARWLKAAAPDASTALFGPDNSSRGNLNR
jgi:CheY-like chemotaxis protein